MNHIDITVRIDGEVQHFGKLKFNECLHDTVCKGKYEVVNFGEGNGKGSGSGYIEYDNSNDLKTVKELIKKFK